MTYTEAVSAAMKLAKSMGGLVFIYRSNGVYSHSATFSDGFVGKVTEMGVV